MAWHSLVDLGATRVNCSKTTGSLNEAPRYWVRWTSAMRPMTCFYWEKRADPGQTTCPPGLCVCYLLVFFSNRVLSDSPIKIDSGEPLPICRIPTLTRTRSSSLPFSDSLDKKGQRRITQEKSNSTFEPRNGNLVVSEVRLKTNFGARKQVGDQEFKTFRWP